MNVSNSHVGNRRGRPAGLPEWNVLILTEGGQGVGFGHVTRCLSLAQAFEARGYTVQFLISGDESVRTLLPEETVTIADWLNDAPRLRTQVESADIVIIDSYHAELDTYDYISQTAPVAVYLDDTCRIDYPAGIVVNWSISANALPYRQKENIFHLLGLSYLSLRKAFQDAKAKDWDDIQKNVNRVMITFGGDDSKNLTPRVLQLLMDRYPECHYDVVIGNACENKDAIHQIAEKHPSGIDLHHALTDDGMKALMQRVDIAISSGGQTLAELARMGVPTIAVIVAENQRSNVLSWEKTGFIENAGNWDDPRFMENLSAALERMRDYSRRCQSLEVARQIISGNGADRIIDFIEDRSKER
ncbi:MAG: UDP-2,4-diacetamido-2,4,6-trideoxy-beta-L-altropyranose hydrolase [Candidatus Omnitrophota bacterium]